MYRFHFSLAIFIYFLINTIILFWQGNLLGGICCLIISIAIPLAILGVNQLPVAGFLFLLISITSVFSDYFERFNDPKYQYMQYVYETLDGKYYGEHENKVRLACGIQKYVDDFAFIFNLFKAIYYDIFMSAIDFLLNAFSEPAENKCLIAVKHLNAEYPEFKIPIE
ncbi:hypothetical protein A9Q81_13640 [Gammaproteobacteria bacterium 42_54_T18]|nr:hypothetical protein A9Q81_13640 [Gammaproteobacteria bacterium 42_54_T18]